MGNKKIALSDGVVKYLFSGVDCEIAHGEDGYVAYGFTSLYPSEVGIFVPNEVDRSSYNAVFPKSFEAYFLNLDEEFAYLSRLLEVEVKNAFLGYNIQFVPGMILRQHSSSYIIFRFDELLDLKSKTDLLCRVESANLEVFNKLTTFGPEFLTEASTPDGRTYFYFILPVHKLFDINDGIIAVIFSFLESLRKR